MDIEWKVSDLVEYPDALRFMKERVAGIIAGKQQETIWLLEHPPLYTAGSSAHSGDLLEPDRFPVYQAGRGGEYTYHGPGQRIAYVMLNLKKRYNQPDIKQFVYDLEEWIIRTLAAFGVKGERRNGRVGIWVVNGDNEQKIAAIGIRLRKWVSYHGIAINLSPDLSHFTGIVPCGIREHGVTSLKALGVDVTMDQLDDVLRREFIRIWEE